MSDDQTWYAPIRDIFNRASAHDWRVRVAQFNRLPSVQKTKTRFHLPMEGIWPSWFSGNLTGLNPGEWVLVVSANPHIKFATLPVPTTNPSPEAWWNGCHAIDPDRANWGQPNVFPQVVQLAAAICDVDVSGDLDTLQHFTANRILFVEFCPFASQNWPRINWDPTMKNIADENEGIRTARRLRRLLFEHGQPKAVLCLGKEATWDVRDCQFAEDRLYRMYVELQNRPGESVYMYQGTYQPKEGPPFLVLGFQDLAWETKQVEIRREIITTYVQHGADSAAFQHFRPDPHHWETSPPRR